MRAALAIKDTSSPCIHQHRINLLLFGIAGVTGFAVGEVRDSISPPKCGGRVAVPKANFVQSSVAAPQPNGLSS
jgi:hypothetical protein